MESVDDFLTSLQHLLAIALVHCRGEGKRDVLWRASLHTLPLADGHAKGECEVRVAFRANLQERGLLRRDETHRAGSRVITRDTQASTVQWKLYQFTSRMGIRKPFPAI